MELTAPVQNSAQAPAKIPLPVPPGSQVDVYGDLTASGIDGGRNGVEGKL